MRLEQVNLSDRSFLVQFHEIMAEFGRVIPWLRGFNELKYATNADYFAEQLNRCTRQQTGTVTPYQFVEPDAAGTFIGGILHFPDSPEHLRDRRNIAITEKLTVEGASYISCLQIRPPRRHAGHGDAMMRRALAAIRTNHGAVWGVVSSRRKRNWYVQLGAVSMSPEHNLDHLWVVYWPLFPTTEWWETSLQPPQGSP